MDKQLRALRRAHTARIKRKTYLQLKSHAWTCAIFTDEKGDIATGPTEHFHFMLPDEREKQLRVWVSHRWQQRQICSCPMCGNPRKYEKGWARYTLQERRHFEL